MVPPKGQAIVIIHAPTAGVVRISVCLSENRFRLRNDPRVYIGKLQPGSSVLPWWRELQAFDGAGVVWRGVCDGEVVEEVVFGVGSIASIGFDEVAWVIPEAEEDAEISLFGEAVGAVRFVEGTSGTSWCSLSEDEEGQ